MFVLDIFESFLSREAYFSLNTEIEVRHGSSDTTCCLHIVLNQEKLFHIKSFSRCRKLLISMQ